MRKEILILGVIILIVIIAAVLGSNYYRDSKQNVRVTGNSNSSKPNVDPEQLVRPDSPTLGPADAKITLVEFYDPECESCAAFAPTVKKILNDYEGRIRLVTRYMPLHPNSLKAAAFTEAAGEQGKYWEAQNLLFEKQGEWGTPHGPPSSAKKPDIDVLFSGYAKSLGLDMEKFNAAVKEDRYAEKIERDRKDANSLGVRRTPTFFVNGRELARFGEPDLRALIEDEMKK
jgi:protein-disulfide isomerase